MSWTLLSSLIIASAISISVLLIVRLLTRRPESSSFNLDAWLRQSLSRAEKVRRGNAVLATSAAFVIVAAAGAAMPFMSSPKPAGEFVTDDKLVAQLDDYARSIEPAKPAPTVAESQMVPDVEVMIERLAARLESAPDDVQGWRMLGWSYLNTGRFQQAASAYAKAIELDPSSAEIRLAYENAKAKASEGGVPDVSSSQRESGATGGSEPSAQTGDGSDNRAVHEAHASVRSMVDGLAERLETSPRDVGGWVHLVRSRIVLGETELAAAAFRKALDVFKDDSHASAALAAAAIELGLTSNN